MPREMNNLPHCLFFPTSGFHEKGFSLNTLLVLTLTAHGHGMTSDWKAWEGYPQRSALLPPPSRLLGSQFVLTLSYIPHASFCDN